MHIGVLSGIAGAILVVSTTSMSGVQVSPGLVLIVKQLHSGLDWPDTSTRGANDRVA